MLPDSSAKMAECLYCGTTYLLAQEETRYFREMFSRMTRRFSPEPEHDPEPWTQTVTKEFLCDNGERVQVKYLHRYTDRDADVYVTRTSVAYHLRTKGSAQAEKYRRAVDSLDYPSVDMGKLADLFPKVRQQRILSDGTCLLIIGKGEEEYPLRLFGVLDGRHVAWIISRLENLCCVLEYNGLVHPRICVDSVYINPRTHQAFLYGDWWCVGRAFTAPNGEETALNPTDHLVGLRNTAAALLGFSDRTQVVAGEGIPQALASFLAGAPCENAYDDFALWDETLIKAYGERKFVDLNVDEHQLYGGEE